MVMSSSILDCSTSAVTSSLSPPTISSTPFCTSESESILASSIALSGSTEFRTVNCGYGSLETGSIDVANRFCEQEMLVVPNFPLFAQPEIYFLDQNHYRPKELGGGIRATIQVVVAKARAKVNTAQMPKLAPQFVARKYGGTVGYPTLAKCYLSNQSVNYL
ncbi:hypothetical protein DVH24_022859 [Malus domestica]|uniref:Uncharacterized protein n=1 Tax=Malus domestica TaxID=3750 RepID=A0A498KSP3_MALDO|nr:hypothetical protein DVH24_022859 [Malus domestica]